MLQPLSPAFAETAGLAWAETYRTKPAFRAESAYSQPLEPARLFNYLTPSQAVALFLGGMAASLPFKWLFQGLTRHPNVKNTVSFNALAKTSQRTERQTTVILDEGLPAVAMMAIKDPHLVDRLKSWVGASVVGYLLGSLAQGVQEVFIRREETQIRAELLNQLNRTFRQSIQLKTHDDNQLRQYAKGCILSMLKQHRVDRAEAYLQPGPNHDDFGLIPHTNYPYEPTHFARPMPGTPLHYRFGNTPPLPAGAEISLPSPAMLHWVKAGVFGAGMLTGLTTQAVLGVMGKAALLSGGKPAIKGSSRIFYEIFNVRNWEALFLVGNGRLLLGLLGLAAGAKLGKTLIDGYREIEVTRKHAQTEKRYQDYNWLVLDPSFHRTAEEIALNDALLKLSEALPVERHYPTLLKKRIETILANVGRNSAPKYFQMTPPVNLVAARS